MSKAEKLISILKLNSIIIRTLSHFHNQEIQNIILH